MDRGQPSRGAWEGPGGGQLGPGHECKGLRKDHPATLLTRNPAARLMRSHWRPAAHWEQAVCPALGGLSLREWGEEQCRGFRDRARLGAFCFLSTTYLQGHKNVHNQKTQRHRERICPPTREEGNSERGGAPFLPLPSHPGCPSILKSRPWEDIPEVRAGAEGRDRQTSIPARAGVSSSSSEKRLLREQRADVNNISLN